MALEITNTNHMHEQLPSAADFANLLANLSTSRVRALADLAEVSYLTLWSIRNGNTKNPRLETVRKVWPYLIAANNK